MNSIYAAVPLPASTEQGEEVYSPKSANNTKGKTAPGVESKNYSNQEDTPSQMQSGGLPINAPTPVSESPTKEENKNRLKEFIKKTTPKDRASGIKNTLAPKNKLEESNVPVEAPESTNSSQNEVKGGLEQNPSLKAENDKDIKVDANKLVEADDKVVEQKKYSGIVWFIGVFVVLLIVVFAFT